MPYGKIFLGDSLQTPYYKDAEARLGFTTDMIFIGDHGLPLDKISMARVLNSRKRDPELDRQIDLKWQTEKAKAHASMPYYDDPRARFEGAIYNSDTGKLQVQWSEDRYSIHAAVRNFDLGRAYQANLLTVNAVLLTTDRKLPIGLRNPQKTDQGPIKHLTPVGFVDLKKIPLYDGKGNLTGEQWEVESVADAVRRRLLDEWEIPAGAFDPEKMRLMGIVYNSRANFDYDAAVLVPMDCDSGQLKSKQINDGSGKGKYDAIEMVDMSRPALMSLLHEFARNPSTNSGHMRGDIALTIGTLNGGEAAYLEALEKTLFKLSDIK